ncbi:MAG: hypothetical protein J1E34_06725 [Oscillospiraceae bacterium]|nr:hypothetical protein [Oscillospiraceae bacterium]
MLQNIRLILLFPLIILTLITTPRAVDTETAVLKSQNVFVMEQALAMGQGITTDGEYFYTSGAATGLHVTMLAKIDIKTMKMTEQHLNPLPDVCTQRGNNHIGGISYYNGKIYAPVEGGNVQKACIVVYDAKTLEATGEIYDLPGDIFDYGIPWLAVDPETGLLYTSQFKNAPAIYVYDVNNNMSFVKELPLTGIGELNRIQGGEFYNGSLYLSQDSQDNGKLKRLIKVDVATGEVTVHAERNVNGNNIESEGMTFLVKNGTPSLYVLDYNKLIGVFLREYNISLD